ncbi:hypothetical protein BC826DRAFT_1189980 [Russula brevipes]|nr:hypothetical protein BC826DRAFT_1189980 [Russula brevipes]
MSGGGGGGDGDNFGVWATNVPPPLGPPEKDEDEHAGRSPTPIQTLDCARARPPTSGVGGAGKGDDFAVHLRVVLVVPAKATTLVRGRRTCMLSVPPTDPTPRPCAAPSTPQDPILARLLLPACLKPPTSKQQTQRS